MIAKPASLPEHLSAIWDEFVTQFRPTIGAAGLESLCTQVYRARDAQRRITADGMIVADSKGNPGAHPALAIEKQAQTEIRQWIKDHGARN